MQNPHRSRDARPIVAFTLLAIAIAVIAALPELWPAEMSSRRIVHWSAVVCAAGATLWLFRLFFDRRKSSSSDSTEGETFVTEVDWERRIEQLQRREQTLADRLATYHGWQEFPSPIDLSDKDRSDDEISELAQKDRQMLKLLSEEAESLFTRIQENVYRTEGKLDTQRMRDDAMDLANRVARVYQPDAIRPLTETNIDQVLRAASRAFLQMLIVTEQLPLNVQHYSLNDLYTYVQRGIKAYNVYKSTEPYWPYVNTAYYLGRLALGANPIAMAAGWAITNVGTRGAKAIAGKLVNQQAVLMLHQMIQVIGYEAANIYGGDFRYRDANWVYAAELTHLLSGVEVSSKTLTVAMREISALRLRNEYDRMFAFRLIAEHKTANPKRFRAKLTLTNEECATVHKQLVKFAKKHTTMSDRQHTRWLHRLNKRLNVGDASEQEDEEPTDDVDVEME